MKQTKYILTAEMLGSVLISLIIIVLYESGALLPGSFSDNANTEFLAVTFMEIITICMIPLSLKLFKFKKISLSLKNDTNRGLTKWGTIRMAMLCVPMMVNTLCYYLFGFNVAFGYMGIIGLICLAFIFPSTSRCINETQTEE